MRTLAFIIIGLSITTTIEAQKGRLMHRYLEKRFTKNSEENAGPVPDYKNLKYWAASPYKKDYSDSIPVFLRNEPREEKADVFFIHPTSYQSEMKTAPWNADVDDTVVNNATDHRSIYYQASVFNGSCRVFAPRYRQAHLKSFTIRDSEPAKNAFNLAYSDIKRAFSYYLEHENQGRPIIIASHSQGSLHAIRLLQEFFDGKPLQKQLVCAYVIGYTIESGSFKHIPVGNSPVATGCVVGWCSYKKGSDAKYLRAPDGNGICVNPLSWTTDTKWVSEDKNQGGIFRDFNKLIPHIASAGIDPKNHILWVSFPDEYEDKEPKQKNLHVLDYNLFWMNIRENVKARIDAFLTK